MRSLKELQGVEREGLKRYDRITGTLRCMDITWVPTCGKENFTEYRKDLVRLQGKGRMQVACRSAARIFKMQNPSFIPGLEAEAQRLKVTFPPAVRNKLNQMKEMELAEQAEEDEEVGE